QESLGCKWSELPMVVPSVDHQGFFSHSGLFGFSPDMNSRVDIRKVNNNVETRCNVIVEGTDQLPWFFAKFAGKTLQEGVQASSTSTSGGGGSSATSASDQVNCEFELGANGPYRRCELIDLLLQQDNKLPSGGSITRLEFQPPAQVYRWNSGVECIPIRFDLRCWSLAADTGSSASAGAGLPGLALVGAGTKKTFSTSLFVNPVVPNSHLHTYLDGTSQFCNAYTGGAVSQARALLDNVDEDIVGQGMNVLQFDRGNGAPRETGVGDEPSSSSSSSSGGVPNPNAGANKSSEPHTLRGYYFWDIAHLADDAFFRKSGLRNRVKDLKQLSWMSLHYVNWELATGVTILRAKIESLVPGVHYRLALLRGKDMPWSENHVDGISGTIVEHGQLLHRTVSSFPGTQNSDSDNFATLHILVHVGQASRVVFAKDVSQTSTLSRPSTSRIQDELFG
ncbi:unnamed protein product, partial [Amoebophrya sp. A25]